MEQSLVSGDGGLTFFNLQYCYGFFWKFCFTSDGHNALLFNWKDDWHSAVLVLDEMKKES